MTKKFNYVYITTNLVNKHQYVGDRSCNINPKNDNYLGSGTLFRKKLKEYGKENFQKEILEFFSTRDEASKSQEKYIRLYHTHVSEGGYNLSWNGGYTSEEAIEKMSNSHKDKKLSNEHKSNIGIGNKKWHQTIGFSKETRKKLSESNKGKKRSVETRKKISKSQKGRKRSKEFCEKVKKGMIGINKGKVHTKEARKNMSKAHLGKKRKPFTQEHCKKISKYQKGKKMSAEACQKMSISKKGKPTWNKGIKNARSWMYNEELKKNKQILNEIMIEFLNKGWKLGRKKF